MDLNVRRNFQRIFLISLIAEFILILLCSGTLRADESQTFVLAETFTGSNLLDNWLQFYEDKEGYLTISEISSANFKDKFIQLEGQSTNFGYSRSTYWLRIQFVNKNKEKLHPMLVLKLEYPNIHYIDFFQLKSDGQIIRETKTGTLRPAGSRDYPDVNFVFFVRLPENEQHFIYFRIKSNGPLNLNSSIQTMDYYLNSRYSDALFKGIFIGFILLASGYFSFLYFQIRDKAYLYLALTGIFLLFYDLTISGFAYMYVWPSFMLGNQALIPIFVSIMMISFVAFSIEFLEIKNYKKQWLGFYYILYLLFILNILQNIFIDFYVVDQITSYLVMFALIAFIPAAFYSYRQGYKPATSYFIGLIIMIMVAADVVLLEFGYLPSSSLSDTITEGGSVLIFLFWSKALAARLGLIRSEKDKAVYELKKSREQLALAIKGGNLGTYDWDLKNNQITYNQRWAEILGYTLEELNPDTDTWAKFVHPDDKDIAQKQLSMLLDGNIPSMETEYRMQHKSGEWIWILDSGQVVERDPNGESLRVTGTHLDITKMRNAEQQIKINEQRYRLLFETAGNAIMIMKDDLFINCNEQTLKLFRCTKDQIIGKPPYEFSPQFQPDGRNSREKAMEIIAKAYGGQSQFFEWQHSRYDGSLFNAEVSLNLVEFQDNNYIQAIVRDITERKRADQLLEILNEAAVVMQKALTTAETLAQVSKKLEKYGLNFTYMAMSEKRTHLNPKHLSFPSKLLKRVEKLAGIKIDNLIIPIDANQDICQAIQYQKVTLIKDALGFMRSILPPPANRLAKRIVHILEIPNFILAPLISDDIVSGLITVQSNELSEADISAIRVFTHQLAAALRRAHLYEQASKEISNRLQAEEALRQSEARLQSIFNVAPVGIGILIESKLSWFNDKLCDITGYNKNLLLDKHLKSLYNSDEDYAISWNKIKEELQRLGSAEIETSWKRQDGKNLNIILSVAPINPTDHSLGLTLTAMDVTDRKTLEDQFRQSQKMEAVGQLAGGIAHDFNNLLTVISGYSNLLLLRQEISHDMQDKLEMIHKASERAEALTRQLLAFSRKQIAQIEILDINQVINDSIKILTRLIGEDISIQIKLTDELPYIMADPHQVEQILMNLLVNARDAIHERQGYQGLKVITVETRSVFLDRAFVLKHLGSQVGPNIVLSISDNGIGMDKQTLAKIFEPFFTTKEQGKGTGLGLATVYGIVKQNKAYITVYSEPNKGTNFNIYWPIAEIEDQLDNAKENNSGWKTGTESLLLVEDDDSVRSFALESLQALGYNVYCAASGNQALEILSEQKINPDLIISDVVMPGLNGFELSEKIKKINPDIKVIFTSGYTDEHIINQGFLKKDVNFLQKPYSLVTLSSKIREVLDN